MRLLYNVRWLGIDFHYGNALWPPIAWQEVSTNLLFFHYFSVSRYRPLRCASRWALWSVQGLFYWPLSLMACRFLGPSKFRAWTYTNAFFICWNIPLTSFLDILCSYLVLFCYYSVLLLPLQPDLSPCISALLSNSLIVLYIIFLHPQKLIS